MGNLYIQAGGGAGDFIFNYFRAREWRCLPTIKKYFSDCRITFVAGLHNPSSAELVYTNPHIDAVLAYKWYPPGHPKEQDWKHMVTGKNLIDWADRNKIKEAQRHGLEHKIWLTTQEQIIINDISSGKYVAIHPFAGLPHRGCLPHPYDGKYKCYPDYKYAESANLLAEAGYKVVFVGKTSYDGVEELRGFEEKLDFKVPMHSNVISLVNKASLRLNTELVRRANGFMGSHSSMLSAAWTNEVPSVFFYPGWDEHGNRRSVREHGGTTGTWALEREYHNYFEHTGPGFLRMNPREPVDLLLSHMR